MAPELAALAAFVALRIVFGLTVTAIVASPAGIGDVLGSREKETV